MLRDYRRRFVVSTMVLISLVLIVTLGIQYIMIYRNTWDEMKTTMSLVSDPWDKPGDNFRTLEPHQWDKAEDEREKHVPSDGVERTGREGSERGQIITVFYTSDTDSISILQRDNIELDSALIYDAVRAAEGREESFGVVREMDLIYYREALPDSVKYAFADVSYVRARLVKSFLELLIIFVMALVLFYFISRWLAKRAAKPMEQAMEMERQFVADISHDLKTPITVIIANNSILRSDPESKVGEQLQWIESTDTAAKNMMQLIEQMLTLSSLESVTQAVKREPLNLSHIVEKCTLQLESLAYDRRIELQTDIPENISVVGDREYAERICTGLVENALKYEPDGGQVHIQLIQQRKKVLFRVKNAGSVIAPEDLPHIFERFYRGDKTRNRQKGYGLGLPIIKQMADLMECEISVESDAEQGTVFTAAFPVQEN